MSPHRTRTYGCTATTNGPTRTCRTRLPDTLALTTVTFDMTGRILDADVEINSFAANLTTSDTNVGVDLESIVMHEAGHFLGLSHEAFAHATMNAAYDAREPFDFRTLEADDVAGICTIYPPDRGAPDCHDRPTPLHGFTRFCADESDTATSRSELSMGGAGCACSLDQSNGRAGATSLSLFAAASAVGARRIMKKRRRGDT
jgi:hypothetical protein